MTLDEGLLFRFSYGTISDEPQNKLLRELFKDAGVRSKHRELAWNAIDQFPVVTKYLQLIAQAHHLDYRDPLVASAMIFGNELLDTPLDYSSLEQYVLDKTQRTVHFPHAPCHHNIHVDVVGFMELMAPTEENKRDCRVIPGKIYGSSLHVLPGTDPRTEILVQNPFEYTLSQGEVVATHRKMIIAKINEQQAKSIVKYGFDLQKI